MDSQELTLISFAGIFYIIVAIIIALWALICGNRISIWIIIPICVTIVFGLFLLTIFNVNFYIKCFVDSFIAFIFMTATKIWTYISPSYKTWNYDSLIPLNQSIKNQDSLCEHIQMYEKPLKYAWKLREKIFNYSISSKCELMSANIKLNQTKSLLSESTTIREDWDNIKKSVSDMSKKNNNLFRFFVNALGVTIRKTFYTNIYWETLLDPFSSLRRIIIPLLISVILGYIFWPSLSEAIKFMFRLDLNVTIEESPVKILTFIIASLGMLYLFRFLLYFKYHLSDEVTLDINKYNSIKTLQECTHSFRNGFETISIICIISFLAFKCFDILERFNLNLNILFASSSVFIVIISIIVLTIIWMFKKGIIDKFCTKVKLFEAMSDIKYLKGLDQNIEYNGIEYSREWLGNQTKLEYLTFDHVKRNPNVLKFEKNVLRQEAFFLKKHILCDTDYKSREDFKIELSELESNKFNLFFSSLRMFIGKRKFICIYPIVTALLISYFCLKIYEQLFPKESSPVDYDEREMFMQLFYITLIGCNVIFYILDAFDVFNYPIFRKLNIGDILFLITVISVFIIFISGLRY